MPRAVVVGSGFGCRVHVPALRAAGFEIAALVGQDPERTGRRAQRAGIGTACTSLADALALPGVEAVTIATPPDTHAALAIEAAEAGRHVLCEKPFALDVAEAEAMLAAAGAAGVTHLVGHEFRWAPERSVVGRAIADGAIGEPRFATFVQYVPLVADPAAKVPSWWFDRSAGGGWLGASGSHVVDQIRVWLGEFAEVSAELGLVSDRDDDAAEDSFTVRFRLRSGLHGTLQQTAAAWGPYAGMTRVAGTEGTIWVEGDEAWLARAEGTTRLPVPDDLALPDPPAESDDPRHRFTHLEIGPFTRLCEVLRAGVEGRSLPDAVPVPTFADGVADMRVLDAIRVSASDGGGSIRV
ncbi:MAG TPA: Gfo/Idh/MocA family oxidoreductase [Acidimicrobiia bacterium]|nr:Gfo/Idh/MocA family oxidoreductase [Acidimicrobiia bacterium]